MYKKKFVSSWVRFYKDCYIAQVTGAANNRSHTCYKRINYCNWKQTKTKCLSALNPHPRSIRSVQYSVCGGKKGRISKIPPIVRNRTHLIYHFRERDIYKAYIYIILYIILLCITAHKLRPLYLSCC